MEGHSYIYCTPPKYKVTLLQIAVLKGKLPAPQAPLDYQAKPHIRNLIF